MEKAIRIKSAKDAKALAKQQADSSNAEGSTVPALEDVGSRCSRAKGKGKGK